MAAIRAFWALLLTAAPLFSSAFCPPASSHHLSFSVHHAENLCSSKRANPHRVADPLSTTMASAGQKQPAFKGFGSMPDAMISRVPLSSEEKCACCSDKEYKDCCKPYHTGEKWPEEPVALMRSRYSAYAYRLPDWIMEATHRTNVDWRADKGKWRRELTGFCDGFDFLGLSVVEETPGETEEEHFVEFVAKLRTRKQPRETNKGVKGTIRTIKSRNGEDFVHADFREKSRFLRENGKWMYAAGDVDFDPQVELEDGAFKVSGNAAIDVEVKDE